MIRIITIFLPIIVQTAMFTLAWEPVRANEIRFGAWRTVDLIDPAYTTTVGQSMIDANLFEGLVVIGRDRALYPAQAHSWSLSDDGLTYTFYLREGITWSDRTPVVAEDFVIGFRRLVDPALDKAAKPTYLAELIENAPAVLKGDMAPSALGVKALDARTLEIRLTARASYFLSILANSAFSPIPSHVLNTMGEAWSEQRPLVSNGQYELLSSSDNTYVMRGRNRHWDPAPFETLSIKLYESNTLVFRDLLRGNLDFAMGVPGKQADYVDRNFSGHVDRKVALGTYYGMLNTLRSKFADANVRRALSMLIDRARIASSLGAPEAFAGRTFSAPQLLATNRINTPEWLSWPMERRIETAQRLLAEAGYTDQSPLEINIAAGTFNEFDRIAFGIRSMWSRGPISASIEKVSGKELGRRVRADDYDFALGVWYADYDDPLAFLLLLKEDGPKNHANWSDPEYERLLRHALAEPDVDARRPLYDRMEAILAESAPVFAILYPEITVGVSDRIESYTLQGFQVRARDVVLKDH